MAETAAVAAVRAAGVRHRVVEFEPVGSVEEAAVARGVPLHAVTKTIVVRRGEGDLLMVLVPGDRTIDWRRLRVHLGVSRLSLASGEEAHAATGYRPGTITPFGSTAALPVIADASMEGSVSVGGGAPGVAIEMDAADLVQALAAVVADVTQPVKNR